MCLHLHLLCERGLQNACSSLSGFKRVVPHVYNQVNLEKIASDCPDPSETTVFGLIVVLSLGTREKTTPTVPCGGKRN